MKHRKELFLILILLYTTSGSLLAEQDSPSLRIVSYNLENFWDSNPHNTEDEWNLYKASLPPKKRSHLKVSPQYNTFAEEFSNWHNPVVLDSKINRFLEVIKLMKKPDIIGLQELESAGNKSTVFDTKDLQGRTLESRLRSLGYKYFIIGAQEKNNPVSVTTAFISKVELPPLAPIVIKGKEGNTSARDLQAVVLNLPHERVVLINNHWKSKRGGGNEEARVETAKILRKRINQEQSSPIKTHLIVLGDLNTAYYEKPLATLGTTYSKTKALLNPDLLYNLWYEKPEEGRWETSFSGIRGTLSHILISSSLLMKNGFHYSQESFKVYGHKKPESDLLMNADGSPYRWQTRFYYTSFYHIGKGYSDHLPLVASFSYKRGIKKRRKKKKKPSPTPTKYEETLPGPSKILFNKIEPCQEDEALNLLKVHYQKAEDLNRKCVILEIDSYEDPLPLFARGKYQSSYIIIPNKGRTGKNLVLGITMASPFNWRPNIYDSRIDYKKASIEKGEYNDNNWHPRSNKCFQRMILQRKGGALRKVMGRIGYSNGYPSIHVTSREASQIKLENLPEKKKQACSWGSEPLQQNDL